MLNIVLDVVIGLVFIYLLYSLLATSIQEAVATILHRRANTLHNGIRSMLTNTRPSKGGLIDFLTYIGVDIWVNLFYSMTELVKGHPNSKLHDRFYNHPIIKNYGQNLLFKKPSYLSAGNFSVILIETIKDLDGSNQGKAATFDMLRKVLRNKRRFFDKETHRILTLHMQEAAGDIDVLKYRLGKWYNDTMDRVSGWYKRNTQFWLFAIGIVLAVTLNIDSVEISNYLSDNKTARQQMAQLGAAAAGNPRYSGSDSVLAQEVLDSIKKDLNHVNTIVGLGWGDYGSNDPRFRKYCMKATPNTGKLWKAFATNRSSAQKEIDSLQAKIKQQRSLTHNSKDAGYYSLIADSLDNHKEDMIAQRQFAMLYGSEDFNSNLKTKYVLCYRLWSLRKWAGFLLTAFAIGLGAPFWFDLLNKFVSLRSAVKSVNSSGSTTRNNNINGNPEIDG